MSESGIYVINIHDPDNFKIIIKSIDRVYAHSRDGAVEQFKKSFPWRSNWPVIATPT